MSNINDIYEVMKKYGQMMVKQPYPVGDAAKMIIQTSEGVFATKDGADMGNLREKDIERLPMETLPIPKTDVKAVVYSQTPFCQQVLREAKPFRACLDDMAQIFGPTAYIVDGRESNKSMGKSLMKALKNNEGCLVLKGINKDGEGVGYTMTRADFVRGYRCHDGIGKNRQKYFYWQKSLEGANLSLKLKLN